MKMKKLLVLMALALPVLLLSSCGSSKDEPLTLEQQLIGSWTNATSTLTYVFNADHTGFQIAVLIVDGKPITNTAEITWSLEGNVLTIATHEINTFEISIKEEVLHVQFGNIFYEFYKAKG